MEDLRTSRAELAVIKAVQAALAAFAFIAMGGLGSLLAGQWADRLGRENITIASMAVSGICCLLMGWLLAAPVCHGDPDGSCSNQ